MKCALFSYNMRLDFLESGGRGCGRSSEKMLKIMAKFCIIEIGKEISVDLVKEKARKARKSSDFSKTC